MRPAGAAELGQNMPDVSVDGPLGDEQPCADLPVGQAACDQFSDLAFAPGQQRRSAGCGWRRLANLGRPQRRGDLIVAALRLFRPLMNVRLFRGYGGVFGGRSQ
jgi:hypothetical protein